MSHQRFEPKNPDYRAVATATFDSQPAMHSLGHFDCPA